MLSAMIGAAVQAAQKAASSVNKKKGSGGSKGNSGSSVSFDPDFDYAEAIANTTDAAERRRLLAERQAKIDALGLAGKVGSNDAVSVWTEGYRPYWVSGGEKSSLSVTGLYDAAAKARLQAFEAAKENIRKQLEAQYDEIEQAYRQGMTQTEVNARRSALATKARLQAFEAAKENIRKQLEAQYDEIEQAYRQGMTQTEVNARRSALANEEKLAALGLNMGGAYGAPTSGYTETSRVAMDNAYRSDQNGLAAARLAARSAAARDAAMQENSLVSGYYSGEASAALQQAQSQLSQYNADRNYSISLAGLTGYLNGLPTMAYQKMQGAQEQTAYERAMTRWKTYGYVLPADAALLGVAAGTPTSDQSYRAAQLRLDQMKTNYQISK